MYITAFSFNFKDLCNSNDVVQKLTITSQLNIFHNCIINHRHFDYKTILPYFEGIHEIAFYLQHHHSKFKIHYKSFDTYFQIGFTFISGHYHEGFLVSKKSWIIV